MTGFLFPVLAFLGYSPEFRTPSTVPPPNHGTLRTNRHPPWGGVKSYCRPFNELPSVSDPCRHVMQTVHGDPSPSINRDPALSTTEFLAPKFDPL